MRTVPIHARKASEPKEKMQTVVGVKVGGGVPIWIQGSSSEAAIHDKTTAKAPNDAKTPMREICDVLGRACS
jgi:hypothetical protein